MGRFDKLAKLLGVIGEEASPVVKKLTQQETDDAIREWAKKKGIEYKQPNKLEIPKAPTTISPETEALEQSKIDSWKQSKLDYEQAIKEAKEREELLKQQQEQIEKDKQLIENAEVPADGGTVNIDKLKKTSGMALGLPVMNDQSNYDKLINKLSEWKKGLDIQSQQGMKKMGMEPLSQEDMDLINQMGMMAPSMGVGKAAETAGPELLKQLLKKSK